MSLMFWKCVSVVLGEVVTKTGGIFVPEESVFDMCRMETMSGTSWRAESISDIVG
jgi:hypothetical protein